MEDIMDEWSRCPSTEGCPDYSSRDSTEKGLGLDKKVPKTQYAYPIREAIIAIMIIELIRHRLRWLQSNN